MKRREFLFVAGESAAVAAGAGLPNSGGDRQPASGAFPLIEVSGDAYQLGYQHGKQAATLVQRYLLWIQKLTRKRLPELSASAARFLPFIERLSATFVKEIRGLADGAGISFDEALLCQARAEACANVGRWLHCIRSLARSHCGWSRTGRPEPGP
jgi:hypothetical protein